MAFTAPLNPVAAARDLLDRELPPEIANALRQADSSGDGDIAAGFAEAFAEQELDAMVAAHPRNTGVSNTLFISPRGHARHGPRIKVAIDPPDNLDASGKQAVVDFDGVVRAGDVPDDLLAQVRKFIALNRDVLNRHWAGEIDGVEVARLLRPIV